MIDPISNSADDERYRPVALIRRLLTEQGFVHWRRYAVAISPLIFVFLGMGYGTVRTRAVRAGAALIALLVILIYWSVQAARR